jgi:hypothetical protein
MHRGSAFGYTPPLNLSELYDLAMLAHLCAHTPDGYYALISKSPGDVAICCEVPGNTLKVGS